MKKLTPLHAGYSGYERAFCGVNYPAFTAGITMCHWLATCKNCLRILAAKKNRGP